MRKFRQFLMTMAESPQSGRRGLSGLFKSKAMKCLLTTLVLISSALTSWAVREIYDLPTEQPVLIDESNYQQYGLTSEYIGYRGLSKPQHLYWMTDMGRGRAPINYVLLNDIVMNSGSGTKKKWVPLGGRVYNRVIHSNGTLEVSLNEERAYTGTFDGNGHTISGLYFDNTGSILMITQEESNNYAVSYSFESGPKVGFIGVANGATIKNLGIINATIINDDNYVGGIVGYCINASAENYNGPTTITNCWFEGVVRGKNNTGGICGYGGNITKCYNTGTVSGAYYTGGICGYGGNITNCYNTGAVSGSAYTGGICGNGGTQTNCYTTGMVSSSSSYFGGICGSSGTQNNCYYLEGSCSRRGGGVSATADEFASGKIAYLLNGNTFDGTTWRQTLFTDAAPLLAASHKAVTGYINEVDNVITTYGNVALSTDYTVGEGKTLIIPEGATVTTIGSSKIINNGTLIVEGTISGNNLDGNGAFYYAQLDDADVTLNTVSVPYKGSAYTVGDLDVSYASRIYKGKTFTYSNTATMTYQNNTSCGTATVTWNGSITREFTIAPKAVTNPTVELSETLFTYNGEEQKPTVTLKDGETVIDPSEYTVTYPNDVVNDGDKTITITDNEGGNYAISECSAEYLISSDNYYTITNADELYAFAELVNSGTTDADAILVADIVVNENVVNQYGTLQSGDFRQWTPIGNYNNHYQGRFDGRGHSISGLYLNGDGNYVGLFGYAEEATVRDVGIVGSYIKGGQYVAGICGYGYETSINMCYNAGTIIGTASQNTYAGGICGRADGNCHITNCYNLGKIDGVQRSGGICGTTEDTVKNCYNAGSLGSGISDICFGGKKINCYNTRQWSESGFANGYIGYNLNEEGKNTIWRQNLMDDALPTLDKRKNPVTGYFEHYETADYVEGNAYLSTNYEVVEGRTLRILADASLTTTGTAVITNNGTLRCDGYIYGNDLEGNGNFVYTDLNADAITLTPEVLPYQNKVYKIGDGLEVSYNTEPRNMCGKVFTYNGDLPYSPIDIGYNTYNAGTGYVYFNYSTKKYIQILPLEVTLDWGNTTLPYNGDYQVPTPTFKGVLVGDWCSWRHIEGWSLDVGGPYTATVTEWSNPNYVLKGNPSTEFYIVGMDVPNLQIELSASTFTFDGSEHVPTVTVKNGESVIDPSEYTVIMPEDAVNAGDKTIAIRNKVAGIYNINSSTTFTIEPKEVTLEWGEYTFTYNGSTQKPEATATGLIGEDECEVIVSGSQTDQGSYTATATGLSNKNYKLPEANTKVFTINPKEVTNPTIELSATEFTYNGSAQTPTVTVKDGETTIASGEYAVSYSNNTNAGTATVTIADKANGNYTVSGSATFTISPKVVSNPTIELSATEFTYDGSAKTPTVTSVKDGSTIIASGEYTVSYSNNTNAGTATVTIADKANGNYTVSGSATFTISPKEVTNPTIALSQTSYTYNGSAQTPTVTVKDGSTTIASGEYTVSYSNNTNAGTATVTIADKANGNYTVSGSATFTISPKEVSSPTIALSQTSYTYDGSAKTPTVSSVKDGSTTIASGEYTVSYSNNTNAGTATVTIADKANGNYTVSGSATFTISPKEVSSPTIEFSDAEITYTGSALTPTITVKDGSTVIPTSEYTVGYSNNTNAGTANLTITNKANGNYTVSGETTFTINPKTVSNPTIILNQTRFIFDGTAKSPTVTSVKDGSTVIPASEYTVTMPDDAVSVGDYTVEIEDIDGGNYTVRGTATYVINLCTEHQFDDFGQCTVCGEYTQPELVDGVYQIASAAHLYWFASWVNKGNAEASAVLTADIVVNSNVLAADGSLNGDGSNFRTWTPIGYIDEEGNEYYFSGTFDGNEHTVSGLYSVDYGYRVGLIGEASEATIKNVGIVDSYFSGAECIGGVCGYAQNNCTIDNCYNTGTINSAYEAGGICGYAYNNSTINNCNNTGAVSSENTAGGICSYADNCTITNCYNTGAVSSEQYEAGGNCGYAQNNCTIDNCYNTGTVSSEHEAGGICGVLVSGCTIVNCYNTGAVNSTVYYAGGICGATENLCTITNCYNTGAVTCGESYAGGICGYAEDNCTINNCNNTGAVTCGVEIAGGICGYVFESAITNCYNTGTITCDVRYAGGICGYAEDLTATNNFYLAGCATVGEGENVVVQNGVGVNEGEEPAADAEGQTTAATASEFASGRIAYLLNGSEFGGSVWHQTLFADEAPVLNAEHNSVTGYITEEGGVVTVVGSVVVESAYEVANGKTLNIPAGASLTTTGDGVITNNGTIVLNGTLAGNDLAGSGNFIYGGQIATTDLVLNNNANYVYKGSAYDDIEFTVSRTICGKVFTYGDAYTVSYANNINAGQATISLTNNNDAENVVSSQFTIKPVEDEVVVTVTLADKSVAFSGAAQTYNSEDALTIEANNALYNISWVSASGNAASVSGTNAAEYAFGWNAEMFSNTSDNFTNVRFDVTDGKLIITPNTEVVVTVTENSGTLTYNGEEHSVSGYSVAISDATGVYTEDDIAFSGSAVAKGITVGEYAMLLSAADFSNTNENFAEVTFNIVDGALTITKAAEAPNKPAAAMETRYINTQLVALPADWAWSGNKALELGDNSATANYAGADKGNYEVESVDITITRLECLHNEGNELLYILEPTCTHKGYTGNLSCKLCGEIYEYGDSIPALGHDFVETVVAPTCTTDGYTEHLCNRCQHIEYSDTVAATGHKADSVVFENVVAATCTEAGSRDSVVYCSVCQIELSRTKVVIPAGHKAGTAVAENLKAATCTVAGSVDSVVYCTVCKEELSRKTVVIDATGHKADSIVIENVVAATYTAAGSYDSVVYCSVCKVELSRTKVEVPQLVKPAEVEVVEVVVSQIEYTVGDSLKLDGGKIVIATSDSTTAEVVITPEMVSGFKPDSIGVQTVTVAFEIDGVTYTTTFDVEVKDIAKPIDAEVVISHINYTVGDSLKLDGGKIVIATSDSTTAEVVITPEMVSGFNPDSVGVQTVTVSFEIDGVPYTTTFDVEVKEAEVIEIVAKSIAVSAKPAKVEYKQGEALDVTGGKITVTYSDNTTAEIELKADMVSGFDADKVGEQKLTVSYTVDGVTLTATFEVTVKADDTAISEDEAAAVNIYAYGNTIVVENATADILVFDSMGRMISRVAANADRTEIQIGMTGVYIVKTGTTAKRVMIND